LSGIYTDVVPLGSEYVAVKLIRKKLG